MYRNMTVILRTLYFVKYIKHKSNLISEFRKSNSVSTLYAGFLVCAVFVPSVLCKPQSSHLTYEVIYNNTNYVQIPSPKVTKPYNVNYTYRSYESTKENSIEDDRFKHTYEYNKKNQLLIGFAHDPFRQSIPEAEYLNGVRDLDVKSYSNKGDRDKRGVVHLYNMLTCSTGCDPISYKGYGCYCGFLGSGRPTDGIDNCCKLHDECYENIYCPFYTVYFQPYYWKCFNGEPLCALENYKTKNQFINGCAGRLCECDRRFAMCVRRYSCPRGRPLCHDSPLRLLQNLLMF